MTFFCWNSACQDEKNYLSSQVNHDNIVDRSGYVKNAMISCLCLFDEPMIIIVYNFSNWTYFDNYGMIDQTWVSKSQKIV